ncbi:hypothetical protein NONI108955_01040 [Nocardia ninae]|nr:hypothetical protein [Nocardia ninae]
MVSTMHSVRVPDEIWQSAMSRANTEGRTLTHVIVAALDDYAQAGDGKERAAAQVRAAMELLSVAAEALEPRRPR